MLSNFYFNIKLRTKVAENGEMEINKKVRKLDECWKIREKMKRSAGNKDIEYIDFWLVEF